MVATSYDSDEEDEIIPVIKKNVVVGSGYSDSIKIIKPSQHPKLAANIPKMNSKIAEDKLKIFIDFKF